MRLRLFVILFLSTPHLDAGRLQGTGVRESCCKRTLLASLVDLIEVDGGVFFGDSTREERDSWHRRGQAPVQSLNGHLGDRGWVRLVAGLDAWHSHRWLQQGAFHEHTVFMQRVVHGAQDALLDLASGLDEVLAVN